MKAKPRAFRLHFNRLESKRGDKVWTVHTTRGCIHVKHVDVGVPVVTVYKGLSASQPRAFLRGRGVVRVANKGTRAVISDA